VPAEVDANNGTWWDELAGRAAELSQAGITGVWTPAPSKGNFGIHDMGYGVFDHYDLGNYDQKGTVETHFGSRAELLAMVSAMQAHGIEVYSDIVLNHIYTGDDQAEANPAVKQYVFDEAFRNGSQYVPYPTGEITWRIPNAQPGDYYVKIKGYYLDCDASHLKRAYDLTVNWDGSPDNPAPVNWESEPNNGGGQFNPFPASGQHVWAHVNACGDIDEYKVTLPAAHDLTIRLLACREEDGKLARDDQTRGYYPYEIWHNGQNLAHTTLEARTNTGVQYVPRTGTGEPDYSWDFSHFHPVDDNDWLGGGGSDDEIITNTKFFGQDFNTFDPTVQDRLKEWGVWLTNTVGYDGYRLDFVRGFQESFAADWIKAMPKKNGNQRFVVGEYWGNDSRIQNWVNKLGAHGADADAFDFPLKSTLSGMANGDSSWDMRWLNHAGMVRSKDNSLPGTSVVTFVENHDTGKEHDKWVHKDWHMAYAYILFAEGRPCVFYSHFYGIKQKDQHNDELTVQAPAALQDDIKRMIHVRKTYLDGTMTVLSEVGNPWPLEEAADVYVARRQGNGTKTGAILVVNNHDSQTKGLWVDHAPGPGYPSWANKTLVNARNGAGATQVFPDGRVHVTAPPRGYRVYVPEDEYVAP
jgi:alpha-amylase